MLIDFCDGRLDPVISCDKVSVDGNSVSNLISTDTHTRNKGFIAEYFIRPPVNIKIKFPCNIQIYRIVINPIVGSQKSTGFEIFTCSNKIPQSSEVASTSQVTELFLPVGRAMLSEPSIVCFQSVHFRSSDQWRPDNLPDLETYPASRELRHHKISHLNFVSDVIIKISRTIGGSAACIRRLEIWGKPTSSCPQHIHDKIRQVLFPSLACSHNFTNTENTDKDVGCSIINSDNCDNIILDEGDSNNLENGVDIPEDFIDGITCEMMTVPMLLPCGKNIDQSTLEKHITADASWGRPASDPFTGVLLDNKHQAIPNSHLKSRIDQFLLQNLDLLKHLPRTLGKRKDNQSHLPKSSRLLQVQTSGTCLAPVTENTEDILEISQSCDIQSSLISSNTRKLSHPKRKKLQSVQIVEAENSSKTDCGKSAAETSLEPSHKKLRHEDSLKQSLDSALNKMLGNLPTFKKSSLSHNVRQDDSSVNSPAYGQESFGNFSTSSSDHKTTSFSFSNELQCVQCKSSETSAWYKIPCNHYCCRNCLVKSGKTVQCSECKTQCSSSDIIRVYQ